MIHGPVAVDTGHMILGSVAQRKFHCVRRAERTHW